MKCRSWLVAGVVGSVALASCSKATDVASAVVGEAGQAGMSGGGFGVGGTPQAGTAGRRDTPPDPIEAVGAAAPVEVMGGRGGSAGSANDGGCSDGCSSGAPAMLFNPVCPPGREPDLFEPSRCTFEETCKSLGCGDGVSEFGADGCRRPCESSADCARGERCRFTELLGQDCATSSVELCAVQDNGICECTFNADCLNPHICVDATRFPAEQDCAVAAVDCQDLKFFYFNSTPPPGADPDSEKAKAFAACHEAAQARATEINCDLSP